MLKQNKKDYIVNDRKVQTQTQAQAQPKKPSVRAMVLPDKDIANIVSGATSQIRIAIDADSLNGYKFDYDENHDPILSSTQGRLGLLTKRESPTRASGFDRSVIYSPFGEIGTHILIREAWRIGAFQTILGRFAIDYKATPEITNTDWVWVSDDPDGSKFRSEYAAVEAELNAKGIERSEDGVWSWNAGQAPLRWQTPNSMPDWASRLTLLITDIRVEPSLDNVFNWEFVADFKVINK